MHREVRALSLVLAAVSLSLLAGAARAESPTLRCLELPGASRDQLAVANDGRFLTWTENDPATGRDDFFLWEAATGKVVKALEDASDGRLFGEVIVSIRAAGGARALRLGQVVVSPPGLDVRSFVVDAPRGLVYFTTLDTKARRYAVWRVALTGGSPRQLTEWGQAVGVVPDGSALLMWTHNAKGELVKLPLDGSPSVVLASQVSTTYVLGDQILFNPSVGDRVGPLARTALDGSPSTPLLGDHRNSLGLYWNAHVFQTWNTQAPLATLTRFDGKGALIPVARLDGARARAAVMLRDNTYLALLLHHDTSHDGELDDRDEADLCFAAASETAIHQVAQRKAPKRFTGLAARASMLLRGELAGATLRFVDVAGKATLVIESQAAGPTELPMPYGQLLPTSSLLTELTAIAHKEDPSQSATAPDLLVRWRKNERHAAVEFDAGTGIAIPRSGAWGMSLLPRELFDFAIAPDLLTRADYTQSLPHFAVCSGTIMNLGKVKTDLTIECAPSGHANGEGLPKPVAIAIEGLGPGEKRKYTIELGASRFQVGRIDMKVLVGGEVALWTNEHALADVRAYASLAERVERLTGYRIDLGPDLAPLMKQGAEHPAPRIVAHGFSDKPAAEQARIAKQLWNELAAHYRQHHNDAPFSISIDDGTPQGRKVVDGKLSPG